MNAEAMLLVDDGERQIGESDVFLKEGVGADCQFDCARFESVADRGTRAPLLAPGQQRNRYARQRRQRLDRRQMLAGQDFGRRHQRRLMAGLDRRQHGEKGDHRFPAADVALEEPQHACRRRHVAADIGKRRGLRRGEREGQGGNDFIAEAAVALDRPPGEIALLKLSRLSSIVCPGDRQTLFRTVETN